MSIGEKSKTESNEELVFLMFREIFGKPSNLKEFAKIVGKYLVSPGDVGLGIEEINNMVRDWDKNPDEFVEDVFAYLESMLES